MPERDICSKFILPAVERAGWDRLLQIREEVPFTKGRIIARCDTTNVASGLHNNPKRSAE